MADRRGNSVERYYASKEKHRKKKKVRLYFFLSLFCIAAFFILSLTVFFNINSFEVTGNNVYTDAQIIAAAGLEEGDNLFRLNKFKIADKMVVDLPYIGSVNIYRKHTSISHLKSMSQETESRNIRTAVDPISAHDFCSIAV